jgi:hypothetical protein
MKALRNHQFRATKFIVVSFKFALWNQSHFWISTEFVEPPRSEEHNELLSGLQF